MKKSRSNRTTPRKEGSRGNSVLRTTLYFCDARIFNKKDLDVNTGNIQHYLNRLNTNLPKIKPGYTGVFESAKLVTTPFESDILVSYEIVINISREGYQWVGKNAGYHPKSVYNKKNWRKLG